MLTAAQDPNSLPNDGHFLMSALQPNMDISSLALPSDYQLDHRNREAFQSDQMKSARVQEQVRLRMMQKGQGAPRSNGSAQNYTESSSSRFQYNTMQPSFSSRSQVMSTQQKASTFRPSGYATGKSGNYSSRSAMDVGMNRKMSTASQPRLKTQQSKQAYSTIGYSSTQSARPTSYHERAYGNRQDLDTLSLRSLRITDGPGPPMGGEDRYSILSEQVVAPRSSYGGGGSTYDSSYTVEKQMVTPVANPMLVRSSSSTMSQDGGAGAWVNQVEVTPNRTIRAPAMRTLQRFQSTNRMRVGSNSYGTMQQQTGGMGSSYTGMIEQTSRAPSVRSLAESSHQLHDLRGVDEYDHGNKSLMSQQSHGGGFEDMDLPSAVKYLMASDPNLQVLGAAYIQHKCYSDNDAKKQARSMQAIPKLVKLFNHSNQEVQRHATGAMRNLIYDNNENKKALAEENGIYELMMALKEQDDELRKNATGILWNLSSSDDLKDRLAMDTLEPLTDRILTPLSGAGTSAIIQQNASESEIFYNATGFLRNLSSASDKTRKKMRECPGLVDAMVCYTNRALEVGKSEDKSVENAVCVLRNLSYRLYDEMPPSALQRLEGCRKNQAGSTPGELVGCFTPQSKKLKEQQMNADMATFTEVSKEPKGIEWLWNPQILGLYNRILQKCELNKHTTEAAAGALQNITAGDRRWASILSRVALEQERILNPVLDRVRTADNHQLRSLTGLIRNLSRNARNKDDMSTKVVSHLVEKLPGSSGERSPSTDVLVNIIAVLNNLTVESPIAVRDIIYFDGLRKLIYIKKKRDSPDSEKSSRAASSLLANMWQYSKLHRDFKAKGYQKEDFLNP